MKLQKILIMMGIFILLVSPLIQGEIYLWNDVLKNTTDCVDCVKDHLYYKLVDTSAREIGRNKDVPIYLAYNIQPLPYDLSGYGYGGEIDWCNLSTRHFINEYDNQGNLINTSTEEQNIFFENTNATSSGSFQINMRSRDSVIADISCHYTDPTYLYVENVLFGRWTTYMPSYECEGCTEYSLEQMSQETEQNEQITANELTIYNNIQKVVDWNFQIWLIASWIIKIAFVLIAISLIFAGVYYFYIFLQNIANEI